MTDTLYKDKYQEDIDIYYHHQDVVMYQILLLMMVSCSPDPLLRAQFLLREVARDFAMDDDQFCQKLSVLAKLKYLRYTIQGSTLYVQYNSRLHSKHALSAAS